MTRRTYRLKFGKQYRKDLKRLRRSGAHLEILDDVIARLQRDEPLDEKHMIIH